MKIEIVYKPEFVRLYSGLMVELQNEVKEKIELFRDAKNYKMLRVHKLHGKMKGSYSFSVNYKFRIVFQPEGKNKVAMLTIGDHDIYK